MKIIEIISPKPPRGVLASYTDRDGYTISIVGIPSPDVGDTPVRFGRMYISDGKTTVKTGYWMNYPERAWNIPERQWQHMSWVDRAAMEAKQQATAYKPLKDQFAFWIARQDSQKEGMPQLAARKWKTGQNLSPSEANILKAMTRSEFHQQIDQRTIRDGRSSSRI